MKTYTIYQVFKMLCTQSFSDFYNVDMENFIMGQQNVTEEEIMVHIENMLSRNKHQEVKV